MDTTLASSQRYQTYFCSICKLNESFLMRKRLFLLVENLQDLILNLSHNQYIKMIEQKGFFFNVPIKANFMFMMF